LDCSGACDVSKPGESSPAERELSPFYTRNQTLQNDLRACIENVDRAPESQFWRRMMVRAAFAYLEGILYQFRQSTAGLMLAQYYQAMRRNPRAVLKAPETGLLDERRPYVDDKGNLEYRPEYPSLKSSLQYTFKVGADVYFSTFRLDRSGAGWQDFVAAVDVRHQITHPKDLPALDISDAEVSALRRTVDWFEHSFRRLFDESDFSTFLDTLTSTTLQPDPYVALLQRAADQQPTQNAE